MIPTKVYFIFPYPLEEAASQRFRFVQYLGFLSENKITPYYAPFTNLKAWKVYHQKGKFLLKASYVFVAYLSRILDLFRLISYDYVFIHREAAPIGPPVFEFIIAKILRKKIIYDFDDAIWLENYNENNKLVQRLKWYKKVHKIMRWSYKLSVGNKYLQDYAADYNSNCIINPTTIDTENYHNPNLFNYSKNDKLTIGWTGSATTNKYLKFLEPILQKLALKYDFYFEVISDVDPKLDLPNVIFTKWKKETEIEDLLKFDIGVMPLTDDIWAKGKCGFKALQYMSLGIPAVVSPVGVNLEIVDHQINGFIANTAEDWYTCLDLFLSKPEEVKSLSNKARTKIEEKFSVKSNKANFLSLFKS